MDVQSHGDCDNDIRELELAEEGAVLRCQVVRVPHRASRAAWGAIWLSCRGDSCEQPARCQPSGARSNVWLLSRAPLTMSCVVAGSVFSSLTPEDSVGIVYAGIVPSPIPAARDEVPVCLCRLSDTSARSFWVEWYQILRLFVHFEGSGRSVSIAC
jgi:hypothetical protein